MQLGHGSIAVTVHHIDGTPSFCTSALAGNERYCSGEISGTQQLAALTGKETTTLLDQSFKTGSEMSSTNQNVSVIMLPSGNLTLLLKMAH